MSATKNEEYIIKKLDHAQKRLNSIYQNSPMAFISWNREGDIIDLNQAALELFGWEKENIKNKDFISISAFLEEHGFYVSEVQERIYAKKANSKIASLLNISEGSSLLWINRYSFDAARRPLDYVEYYIVDDRWHYLVSFTR